MYDASEKCCRCEGMEDVQVNAPVSDLWTISAFVRPAAARPAHSLLKRGLDIVVSLMLLVFFAPVMLLVAFAIYLDSGGPVLFRQARGGLDGGAFRILKFRTMYPSGAAQVVQARKGDSRITPIGGLLRKTSVDELPQLINVLKGEMSLVGPRPHALDHDVDFARASAPYYQRFATRPGITGLAQARGFRGEIRTTADLTSRLEADIAYIENWSFFLDVKIMVRTAVVVLFQSSAY